jgi:transposase-like protein
MSTINLTDPIFTDADKAREWLESVRWANGVFCAHCGSTNVLRMEGEAHRAGLHNCRDCRKQFSVTVGTVFERSHVPLNKWVLANYLMNSSKKGISAHQLHRTIGVTYKTAWFMAHRLREAMTDTNLPPLGGEGKVVEADEMYHGKAEIPPSPARYGRPYLKQGKKAQKRTVIALVERGAEARAVHLSGKRVTAKNVAEVLVKHADAKSALHTDESVLYPSIGPSFAKHETVRHAANEYARGKGADLVTTNSVEGFFGVFKRGFNGIYQHCGEQHFQRYLDEYTFRYNHRVKLGFTDAERALVAMKGIEGKRLTYRRISEA